jgi:phage minor structural protein
MVNRLNTSLNLYPTSPFTVSSDITRVSIFSAQYCSYFDALMGIVNNFGAHLVRDNFTIAVNDSIGEDKGVTIRYGVNMKDITKVENWDEVCTRLYAFGKDGTRLTSYRESSTQYTLKYTKMITFSQDAIKREYYSTKADYEAALYSDLLRTANKYVAEHCVPQVSYTLKAQPEVVSDIGDTFRVIDETLGVDMLTAVHAYDYDCLTDRYISVEFGNAPRSARGMGFSLLKLRTLYDTSVIGNRQLTFDDDGTVKWVSV